MSTSLSNISAAKTALAKASTLQDVLEIRDKAEAIRVYVKAAAESLETQNAAAEIKLRAERKAGEMLAVMEKAKGNQYTKVLGDTMSPSTLESIGITKKQSSRWQKEAGVDEAKFESYVAECREEKKELTQSGLLSLAGAGHVSAATGENEWYTPSKFIEAARQAMRTIDLDPASCEEANKIVKAKRFYCIADDGLSKRWKGNVWLNPPYSKDLCFKFITKLIEEHQQNRVLQAVVLVNNATETGWGQALLKVSAVVCLPAGRISFVSKNGKPGNSPLQGQMFCYLGDNADSFIDAFSSVGVCLHSQVAVNRIGTIKRIASTLESHEADIVRCWMMEKLSCQTKNEP